MRAGPVTLVAGPPCSGKSTYVEEHRRSGDIVMDWDVLFAEVTGLPLYDHPSTKVAQVQRAWVSQLRMLRLRGGRPAWIIRTAPKRSHRQTYRAIHRAQVVVLETPAEVCIERAVQAGRPDEWPDLIRKWWARYEMELRDVRIVNLRGRVNSSG